MNIREISIENSRKEFSDVLLMSFFRSIEGNEKITAINNFIEEITKQKSLDEIFYTGEEFGYTLSIQKKMDETYIIRFGYQAGPLAGDGGEWEVAIVGQKVVKLTLHTTWIN
jgi:hypothetical protein